jgi:hypothetical protein
MTNIMQCIRELEQPRVVDPVKPKQEVKQSDTGLITLDPKKDPDPYGNFGMPLSYRLRCMGWPEGLS